jgi:hypothetical protein
MAAAGSSRRQFRYRRCGNCPGCGTMADCSICGPCIDRASENPKMKMGCSARKCQRRVAIEPAAAASPPPALAFIPDSMFAQAQVADLMKANPSMAEQEAAEKVQGWWHAAMTAFGVGVVGSKPRGATATQVAAAGVAAPDTVAELQPVNPGDLGFAKTPARTFFPARRQAMHGPSGGVKVVFFVTGEAAFVSLDVGWREFNEVETARLLSDPVSNRGSFGRALAEMRSVRGDTVGASTLPSNTMYGAARHLGPVSASRLNEEKAFNDAAFKEKMIMKTNMRWGCRQCPKWETRLEMCAKRHARMCGERPREPRARSQAATHVCSVIDCQEKFARLKDHIPQILPIMGWPKKWSPWSMVHGPWSMVHGPWSMVPKNGLHS